MYILLKLVDSAEKTSLASFGKEFAPRLTISSNCYKRCSDCSNLEQH